MCSLNDDIIGKQQKKEDYNGGPIQRKGGELTALLSTKADELHEGWGRKICPKLSFFDVQLPLKKIPRTGGGHPDRGDDHLREGGVQR